MRDRGAWDGRFEWAEESGHDLAVPEHQILHVTKVQGGYTRYPSMWQRLTPGDPTRAG